MSDDSRSSTVNMKCNQECWMLCDDRLNTRVSSDGQRNTLLGGVCNMKSTFRGTDNHMNTPPSKVLVLQGSTR